MFERYTEVARRTIFFARYEASVFGSPYIETEHLLLALLREDHSFRNRRPLEPPNRFASESKSVCRSPCSALRRPWVCR